MMRLKVYVRERDRDTPMKGRRVQDGGTDILKITLSLGMAHIECLGKLLFRLYGSKMR